MKIFDLECARAVALPLAFSLALALASAHSSKREFMIHQHLRRNIVGEEGCWVGGKSL